MSTDNKQEIAFEGDMPLARCIDYLESIVGGLRAGRLVVGRGDRRLSLSPGLTLNLEVRAKTKETKRSLAFEMSWVSGMESKAGQDGHASKSVAQSADADTTELAPPRHASELEPATAQVGRALKPDSTEEEIRALLDTLSREALYEKAQRLEIEGRSHMNKEEMIEALARHESLLDVFTREELYERAREEEIVGRSKMSKQELLESLEHARGPE